MTQALTFEPLITPAKMCTWLNSPIRQRRLPLAVIDLVDEAALRLHMETDSHPVDPSRDLVSVVRSSRPAEGKKGRLSPDVADATHRARSARTDGAGARGQVLPDCGWPP